MLILLSIMFVGYLLGYFLRPYKMNFLSKLVLLTVFVLLFVMGIQVGADENIIKNLGSLGVKATIVTVASILGGSILVRLLQNWIDKKQ